MTLTSKVGSRPDGKAGPAWYDPAHKPPKPFPNIIPLPAPVVNDKYFEKTIPERFRTVCHEWAKYGYGGPIVIGIIYILKMIAFGWVFWQFILPGSSSDMEAMGKFLCWGMFIEGVGLSACWGPLGGKKDKWSTAHWHFTTPGTIKLPSLPFLNPKANPLGDLGLISSERNLFDCIAWVVLHAAALWLSFAPLPSAINFSLFAPTQRTSADWNCEILVYLTILFGFLDRTVYVCSRADYYLPFFFVFAFCSKEEHLLAGLQFVQICVWLGAALSKCGPWFPYVTGVMVSNAFFVRIQFLRDLLYDWGRNATGFTNPDKKAGRGENNAPEGSRELAYMPLSNFTINLTHFGTVSEFLFPSMCAFGGSLMHLGLFISFGFHSYIIAMVPLGVPTEWNVVVLTVAFFAYRPEVLGFSAVPADPIPGFLNLFEDHPWIGYALLIQCVAIPILGNIVPRWVGFLSSYRYYAGNWPCQVYLLKNDAQHRLFDPKKSELRSISKRLPTESDLEEFKMRDAVTFLEKLKAFRLMYWHGRGILDLLHMLLDNGKAGNPQKKSLADYTKQFDDYYWLDGEVLAGITIGHNFGDGYLHDRKVLIEIQKRCNFAPGELLCISCDAQSILSPNKMPFELMDAATCEKTLLNSGVYDLKQGKIL